MKLTCEGCGATLKTDNAKVIKTEDGAVIRAGFVIKCEFCSTEHVAGTEMKRAGRTIDTGGGAYIEGSVTVQGGDFVGGDLVLGDEDGIVIIPQKKMEDVLEATRRRVANEKEKAAALSKGVTSMELNKLDKVFQSLGAVEK